MRQHFVVPSISCREVGCAQRSGVRLREGSFQPLDLGDGPLGVHSFFIIQY